MMTPDEEIMVCAERYALGRKTYIVGIVCKYIIEHIDGMSNHCKEILIKDIENPLFNNYGDNCDKEDWMLLLDKLKNSQKICSTTNTPCTNCNPTCLQGICKVMEE